MLIHNFLENSTTQHPDKTAVIHGEIRVSYNQLNSQADTLAHHLQTNGINKGDCVALLLENSADYVTAYYAILKIGAVASPLNPNSKRDDLQYLINDLEPAAIIASFKSERLIKAVELNANSFKLLIIRTPKQRWSSASFATIAIEECFANPNRPAPPQISPTDLASIIYTSGSTGKPKGVMLSHLNIVSNTSAICESLSITEQDIQMVVLPFFYVMGKSLLNTHMAKGGTVVINTRFMYPADVVHQMIEEKVTSFSGVPSTYAYLLNRSPFASNKKKLKHLRYCSQAGGHMASSLKRELKIALPHHTQIVIMYGATEAAARLTCLDPLKFASKIESIGKPIPNVSIRILNKKGAELHDNKEGELVASGDNIMLGYWKSPKDTANVLSEHGYHTGDIGYRDSEGFLYVLRRKDSLLKVGGHRINPLEIEEYLMTTGLFIETSVVGLPDKFLTNKLIAMVVLKDDKYQHEALMRECASVLPKHKCPSKLITVRSLPKKFNGKIDKERCHQIALKAN